MVALSEIGDRCLCLIQDRGPKHRHIPTNFFIAHNFLCGFLMLLSAKDFDTIRTVVGRRQFYLN